ncbi:hypothetical protein TWF481_006464 [Arthrobotrys musiformis]|uniref:Zn(2)-C6 fungal-type domain-containing protein n=1 Tax=Arthrobotrys musiformis TaxID=47236 RepID=A0AAV9WAI8_9PEZI
MQSNTMNVNIPLFSISDMFSIQKNRHACDRCQSLKLSCRRNGSHGPCARCLRTNALCYITPKLKKSAAVRHLSTPFSCKEYEGMAIDSHVHMQTPSPDFRTHGLSSDPIENLYRFDTQSHLSAGHSASDIPGLDKTVEFGEDGLQGSRGTYNHSKHRSNSGSARSIGDVYPEISALQPSSPEAQDPLLCFDMQVEVHGPPPHNFDNLPENSDAFDNNLKLDGIQKPWEDEVASPDYLDEWTTLLTGLYLKLHRFYVVNWFDKIAEEPVDGPNRARRATEQFIVVDQIFIMSQHLVDIYNKVRPSPLEKDSSFNNGYNKGPLPREAARTKHASSEDHDSSREGIQHFPIPRDPVRHIKMTGLPSQSSPKLQSAMMIQAMEYFLGQFPEETPVEGCSAPEEPYTALVENLSDNIVPMTLKAVRNVEIEILLTIRRVKDSICS